MRYESNPEHRSRTSNANLLATGQHDDLRLALEAAKNRKRLAALVVLALLALLIPFLMLVMLGMR